MVISLAMSTWDLAYQYDVTIRNLRWPCKETLLHLFWICPLQYISYSYILTTINVPCQSVFKVLLVLIRGPLAIVILKEMQVSPWQVANCNSQLSTIPPLDLYPYMMCIYILMHTTLLRSSSCTTQPATPPKPLVLLGMFG